MTRTTSAKAYREETENGNITKKQAEVYKWLGTHGPSTAGEISDSIKGGWRRLSELKTIGYAVKGDKVVCRITGKTAHAWSATIPHELFWAREKTESKPTRKALEEKISHLEARCVELETIIAGYPALMGLIYDKGYQTGREDESRGISVDI